MRRWIGWCMLMGLLASCRQIEPSATAGLTRVGCYLESTASDATPMVLPTSGVRIFVDPKPILTEADIADAELAQLDLGTALMLQLKPAGRSALSRITSATSHRRLVLAIDGTAVGARRFEGPVDNGLLFVFLEMPENQLPVLVHRLKAGVSTARSGPTGF